MIDRVKYQLDNDFVLKTIEPDHWDLYIEENDDENTQMETEDVQNAEVKSEYGDETVFIDEDTDNIDNIPDDPLKLESMQEVEEVDSMQGLTKYASSRDHAYIAQDGSDDDDDSEECQVDATAGSGCNSPHTAPDTKDPAPLSTRFAYSVANKNITNTTSNDISHQAPSENEKNTLFACNVCGIGFKQINLLVNHLKFHTKTEKFSCKLCPFKSKFQRVLKRHNKQNHTKKPHTDKPFACQLCEFKCSAKCYLHIHMKIHTGEMNFACELCEYKTEHKTNLIRHMISHKDPALLSTRSAYSVANKNISYQALSENEENRLFACNVCGIGFKQINLLVNHLKFHTETFNAESNKFNCKLCPFKSKYQRVLKRHNKQNHTKKPHADKPFACQLCEFKCSEKCDLHIHMKIHTGEMNFACELCEYKTEHKTNLIRHMISHKSERLFVCEFMTVGLTT